MQESGMAHACSRAGQIRRNPTTCPLLVAREYPRNFRAPRRCATGIEVALLKTCEAQPSLAGCVRQVERGRGKRNSWIFPQKSPGGRQLDRNCPLETTGGGSTKECGEDRGGIAVAAGARVSATSSDSRRRGSFQLESREETRSGVFSGSARQRKKVTTKPHRISEEVVHVGNNIVPGNLYSGAAEECTCNHRRAHVGDCICGLLASF